MLILHLIRLERFAALSLDSTGTACRLLEGYRMRIFQPSLIWVCRTQSLYVVQHICAAPFRRQISLNVLGHARLAQFTAAFRIKIVMRASIRYSQSKAKILLFCFEIGSVSGDRRFFSGSLLSQPRLIIMNFLLVLLSGWGTESWGRRLTISQLKWSPVASISRIRKTDIHCLL